MDTTITNPNMCAIKELILSGLSFVFRNNAGMPPITAPKKRTKLEVEIYPASRKSPLLINQFQVLLQYKLSLRKTNFLLRVFKK